MKQLSLDELNSLLLNSTIIQEGHSGPKVYRLVNGHYFKILRLKSYISSAVFYHYADRFMKNAKKLSKLGIATVRPVELYLLPVDFVRKSKRTKAVEYIGLPGKILRDLIDSSSSFIEHERLISEFARFIAKLHNLGVYFKAIHFGNVVYNEQLEDKFGLIDIDNMYFYSKPLSCNLRLRNFKPMFSYELDKEWLLAHKELFIVNYVAASDNNNLLADKLNLILSI